MTLAWASVSWESMALYGHGENAWPDPYMVTLGWACNTWWVGTPWDNLDIDRYAVGRHAIGHSRLHSDPGPSLVSLWRIRGRTETLICRTCKLRQHAYSYWVKSGLGKIMEGKWFSQLMLLGELRAENGCRLRYQVKWCAFL